MLHTLYDFRRISRNPTILADFRIIYVPVFPLYFSCDILCRIRWHIFSIVSHKLFVGMLNSYVFRLYVPIFKVYSASPMKFMLLVRPSCRKMSFKYINTAATLS